MRILFVILALLCSSELALGATKEVTLKPTVKLAQVEKPTATSVAMAATPAAAEEAPAIPPDMIIEQLPGAPEWLIVLLNKYPLAGLLAAFYVFMLGVFRGAAQLLLWYAHTTTDNEKDDAFANKVAAFAEMFGAPLAKLGWGTPKRLLDKHAEAQKKPGETSPEPPKAA